MPIGVVEGSSNDPVSRAAIRAAPMKTASWTSPRTPIPKTLPMSRSRGRTVERTTSTTRLCFSSTTPVRTVKPNEKMPTRIRTVLMLANRNRARSASVCGSSSTAVGGTWASASAAWSTLLACRTTFERRLTTLAPTMLWRIWSASCL